MIHTPYGIKSEFNYRPGKPVRDPSYLKFVRSFPCCVCKKQWGIESAHTGPHGTGQKSSDLTAIPLCARDHRTGDYSLHKLGPVAFQERHGISIAAEVDRLNELWKARKAA